MDIDLSLGEDKLELDVVDNGVGIQDRDVGGRKSLGLLGMQERALLFGGEVKVSGKAGEGTRVSVTIPIARKAAA